MRYNTDLNFKLADIIRRRLSGLIRQRSIRISDLVGCTWEQLRAYLESKFLPGMSWDNWGKHGWHIDHIRPLSSFDLSDPEQLKKACHYTNLQPLWAIDNWSKNNRIKGIGVL